MLEVNHGDLYIPQDARERAPVQGGSTRCASKARMLEYHRAVKSACISLLTFRVLFVTLVNLELCRLNRSKALFTSSKLVRRFPYPVMMFFPAPPPLISPFLLRSTPTAMDCEYRRSPHRELPIVPQRKCDADHGSGSAVQAAPGRGKSSLGQISSNSSKGLRTATGVG